MFIESFKLKKDGWHMQLMKFIWGVSHRDFSHICPYWWATIGTLIAIVPLLAWTYLKIGVIKFADWLDNYMYDARARRREKRAVIKTEKAKSLYQKLQDKAYWDKIIGSCEKKFDHFTEYDFHNMYHTLDWDKWKEIQARLHADREKVRAERRAKEQEYEKIVLQRQIKRKQQITKATNFFKPIIKFILILVGIAFALFACYLLYKVGVWFTTLDYSWMKFWNWPWGKALKFILSAIGIIGAIILAIYLIRLAIISLNKWADTWCPPKWMKAIGRGLNWLFTGIGTIFQIIVQMIKDNCPAIDWED